MPEVLAASQYPFEEVLPSASRITWTHTAGKSAQKYLPETTGAGCAFLDYDNDGWMDIYLVNSGTCDFYNPKPPLRNALYRNNRDGTFTDVTEKAGVAAGGYGMGVAVGDYDDDGFPDLYVTQYGRSILYHNNGDGTFTDVTEKAGVAAPGWSIQRRLVRLRQRRPPRSCSSALRRVRAKRRTSPAPPTTSPDICIPTLYKPTASWLFHNNGDGTFTDVSKAPASAKHLGKALGVVATDINNDGRMDLFVANDTRAELSVRESRQRQVRRDRLARRRRIQRDGQARSGMGVDSADFDQDGWMDLFVANIDQEIYSLYQNNHDETFDDQAGPTGIGTATRLMSGWGLKFFDYDNDGNLDLILANGHPDDLIETVPQHVTYREPLLLFHSDGKRCRTSARRAVRSSPDISPPAGSPSAISITMARVDVLISVQRRRTAAAAQQRRRKNHWLGIKLVGKKSNRDAIGARVTYQAGDLKRSRMKVGGGSYLSSHDPRMVLGLGKRTKVDWLEVKWPQPSGTIEKFTALPIDRYITIVEGEGVKQVPS